MKNYKPECKCDWCRESIFKKDEWLDKYLDKKGIKTKKETSSCKLQFASNALRKRIERAWYQNQRRAKEAKKQKVFYLTLHNVKRIENLAQELNTPLNKTMEHIINSFFEK